MLLIQHPYLSLSKKGKGRDYTLPLGENKFAAHTLKKSAAAIIIENGCELTRGGRKGGENGQSEESLVEVEKRNGVFGILRGVGQRRKKGWWKLACESKIKG